MPDASTPQGKKRGFLRRKLSRLRAYNRRLRPPFRQIVHAILYVLMAAVALLLLALAIFPGLQVMVAGLFAGIIGSLFSPAFMASWLPVRIARKLVTFSLSRILRRTRYAQTLGEKLKKTVLFPEEEEARPPHKAPEEPVRDDLQA